ncbi:MAG: hypothetical protein HRT64_12010, partial [Erythrobacter sp.]|nr:hypothetical protein [Erythrobacter sp.]
MKKRPGNLDLTDASRGKRLQRVMADAGVGSRRACESMIENGDVTVNGQLVTALPAWVNPEEDRIVVAGKVLPQADRKIYVMLNKPPRTLSTAKDEPGADRRTVTELVDHPAPDGIGGHMHDIFLVAEGGVTDRGQRDLLLLVPGRVV